MLGSFMLKKKESVLVVMFFLFLLLPVAYSGTLSCVIKDPYGNDIVAPGTCTYGSDSSCTCEASCNPTPLSGCCPVEGQYTWEVSCSGDGCDESRTGNADSYYVEYDDAQIWCDCKYGSGYFATGSGGFDCDPSTPSVTDTFCCCGDDSGETLVTCDDNSLDIICEGGGSSNDVACCTPNGCVALDQCRQHNDRLGDFLCSNGVWNDDRAPIINLNPRADSWTNSIVTTNVACSEAGSPNSGCDPSTYDIYSSTSPLGACPVSGNLGSSTAIVNQHSWLCAYGSDNMGNAGQTPNPIEFRVDRTRPTISHDYPFDGELTQVAPQIIVFTFRDTGDAGIDYVKICESSYGNICLPEDVGTTYCQDPVSAPCTCNADKSQCDLTLVYPDKTDSYIYFVARDRAGNTENTLESNGNDHIHVWIDTEGVDIRVVVVPSSINVQFYNQNDAEAKVECGGDLATECVSTRLAKIPMVYWERINPGCTDQQIDDNCEPDCYGIDWTEVGGPYEADGGGIVNGDVYQPLDQYYWLCGKATLSTGAIVYTSKATRARIDMDEPFSSIEPFRMEWTNATYINISWSGQDNPDFPMGSGARRYNVDFRIEDFSGAGIAPWDIWKNWLSSTTINYSDFYPTDHGETQFYDGGEYFFRVNTEDAAGNMEPVHLTYDDSIKVDISLPTVEINPDLPEYINSDYIAGYDIFWQGTDTYSGVRYYNITYNETDYNDVCTTEVAWTLWSPGDTTDTSRTFTMANDGCTYYFQVMAEDNAGNRGWSEIEHFTVDFTGPDPTSIFIMHPDSDFINESDGLLVEWIGVDDISDIESFDVQWKYGYEDATQWKFILKPGGVTTDHTTETSIFFDNSVTNLDHAIAHGDTFDFRVRARDIAGNVGNWFQIRRSDGLPAETTIDMVLPVLEYSVTDGNDVPITSKIISAEYLDKVKITSTASDNDLSGVESNVIHYDYLIGNMHSVGGMDCGAANPGTTSECTLELDYEEDTILKYWIVVLDNAGNVNATNYFYVVTHPLINFLAESITIHLGETYILPYHVRNMQDEADTVTVTLDGYFLAEFMEEMEGVTLTADRRGASVVLGPNEQKTLHIRVYSSEPDTEYMSINATSMLDGDLIDSDELTITITFPLSFPGIDGLASLATVMLSLPVYAVLRKKKLI